MKQELHTELNCNGQSNPEHRHVRHVGSGLLVVAQCPKAWLAAQSADLVGLVDDVFAFRRTALPPYAGGWLDQHPHWIRAEEIVSIVEAEVSNGKDGNPKR